MMMIKQKKTVSSFFNFQETTFAEQVEEDNLENKHGLKKTIWESGFDEKELKKK